MKPFAIRTVLALSILFGQNLSAQQPTQPQKVGLAQPSASVLQPDRIRFEHLTVADGLPENSVSCMIQDHQGFIWMGTYDGLVRYDGTQMVDFRSDANLPYAFKGKQVRSMHESRNGDIWIGCERLIRYERTTGRFIEYPQQAPEGNRTRTFVAFIHEDQQGNIWTLTWSYLDEVILLNRLNRKTGTWTYFRHDPAHPYSLAANSIFVSSTYGIDTFAFLEDKSGTIWVTTSGDEHVLHRFDPKTDRFNRFTPTANPAVLTDFKRIKTLTEDAQGELYASSEGKGLFRINPRTGQVTQFRHDPKNPYSIRNDSVTHVCVSRDGTVWVATTQGIDRLNRTAGPSQTGSGPLPRFTHLVSKPSDPNSPSPGLLQFLAESPNGDLWFATADGLNRYNRRRQAFERYLRSNEPDELNTGYGIRSFLADQTGVVWVGTSNEGVYKQSRTVNFSSITQEPDSTKPGSSGSVASSTIIRLYEAPSEPGIIWLGTELGLERLDRKTGRRTLYRHEDGNRYSIGKGEIFAMAEDKQGRFWVGTVGGGLHLLDRKRGTFTRFVRDPANPNSLIDDNVREILPASDGTLWIGTYGGLDHYDPVRQTFVHYRRTDSVKDCVNGLIGDAVFALAEDAQKRIWIGTRPGSLQVLAPRTGQFTTILPISNGLAAVQFLLADTHPNCFWVGDFTSGLWLINDKGRVLKHYTRTNGLPINTVFTGHRDKKGFLWIGTGNGMVRLNPSTNQMRHFTQRNGLKGLFTPTWCASNGEVYAGSNNDVLALFPNQAQDDLLPPPVVLTDLAINGQPATVGEGGQLPTHISVAKSITLPHDLNDLTFQVAALSYNRGSESKYAYQLAPIDNDWVQNGIIRQIRYSDLRPGTYTLHVKAANADGVWNEKGVSLTITIRPPWWQTWWAYLLYGLVLGGMVWTFIQYRSRALVRANRLLEERVTQRTNEVREQKEEIEAQRDHLEQTLTELQNMQAQLIQKEKLASLGELTAGIAHEIQNPLNFVNNFSEVSSELLEEQKEALANGDLEEAGVIADDLSSNLRKIHHHGGRAAAIVRGMLEHSRTDSGEKRPTDLNALANEYLKIAYHGLRAKDKTFNCELVTDFAADLGRLEVVPQEIGRVLLNLYNNAFYAVQQRQFLAEADYQPTISVCTKRLIDKVEIRVSDNGTGIPEPAKAKIFQPFFTTKPTGEGTGLGLSLSYDIVTKGHGGTLAVETEEGKGTEFIITLPTPT
ncbi:Sensor protein zraS [Fibrisoma limi BUZ 3]|uniref:histidine kinase n=1 Tax=Fibrisoma limi BUZ 3 TaxID=1185876 RepID=I2GK44_9BACT|nr:Sensor protein zraS [Fibrisoma limi BUZ 3]